MFELRGNDGDETRLVVHGTGYAIAIPGRAMRIEPRADGPRYDLVLAMHDAPIEVGLRMDDVPTAIDPEKLAPALLISYVQMRAANAANVASTGLQGKFFVGGATFGSGATYPLRGDDAEAMEMLAIYPKRDGDLVRALHLTVRFRVGETTPFAYANLRGALLGHQLWKPGELPSTEIWPQSPEFVPPSVRFALTEQAQAEAQEKAELVGHVARDEVKRLADELLNSARVEYPPNTPWHPMLSEQQTRRLLGCVSSHAVEVLARNLDRVQSIHDYRGWLWQCFWAVGNRAELRKTN